MNLKGLLWECAGGFFFRTKAGALWLFITALLCFGTTLISLHHAHIAKAYLNALTARKREAFYEAVVQFLLLIAVSTPLHTAKDWVLRMTSVRWRRWLTEHFTAMYSNVIYEMTILDAQTHRIENVDSRLIDDLTSIADLCAQWVDVLVGKVFLLVGFSAMLWGISPLLFCFLVIYSASISLLTSQWFGTRLSELNRQRRELLSRFRYALISFRDNCEPIAFFRATHAEKTDALAKHDSVVEADEQIARQHFSLGLIEYLYNNSSQMAPALILAERYFEGGIEYGSIAAGSMAFRHVFTALSVLTTNISQLATIHRLVVPYSFFFFFQHLL